jgi:hypothetical protein
MSKLADIETSIYLDDDQLDGNAFIGEKEGTANDVKDMMRMGKEQQLRVSCTPCNRSCSTTDYMSFSVTLASSPSSASP